MSSRQAWESADFPILCGPCLGPNPYIRMQKRPFGAECKSCGRPHTLFTWSPANSRLKRTEICQTCARIKNVCQTCILDLQYRLPVQVRDSILNVKQTIPETDVNRQYFVSAMEAKMAAGGDASESLVDYSKADGAAKELLRKLGEQPIGQRYCPFFAKGECKRGDACPYRHEVAPPKEGEDGGGPSRKHNNIKDRYAGRNDPVAKSMLKRVGAGLTAPEDRSIVTLWISGLDEDINELDLRSHFVTFGELKSVSLLRKAKGAFVVFMTREGAEEAASVSSANGPFFNIKGKSLRVAWGKSKGRSQFRSGVRKGKEVEGRDVGEGAGGEEGEKSGEVVVSELDRVLRAGVASPPGAGAVYYPSMNPNY